jgi:hypothetical protein
MRSNYRDQYVAFTNPLFDCFKKVLTQGDRIDIHENLSSIETLSQTVAQASG